MDFLSEIKRPKFPDKNFSIINYKILADGKTDCRNAITKAIDDCFKSGGGYVIIPAGKYFVKGPIYIKSNVNLHLEKNALMIFSTDPDDYLPAVFTRWEGVECYNYSPLIYSYEEENIGITGEGVIDGQGDNFSWWPWKGKEKFGYIDGTPNQADAREKLFKMCEEEIPVEKRIFGKNSYLRPSMIQQYKCRNILIEGLAFKDSPMWFIHPVLSTNITIENITVIGHGPNNDGCDPESCKNVLIKNCSFDTGDDCIAIKSGRNNDGRRINIPSENIIIQDCIMKDGHGGVTIGSEISGGAKNIHAENCRMDSPNLERALRIKTNSVRGGSIEEIHARNIEVGKVSGHVIDFTMHYEEGDQGSFAPVIKNINIQNVIAGESDSGIFLSGYERSPISNIRIENCNFNSLSTDPVNLNNVENILFEKVIINNKIYNN